MNEFIDSLRKTGVLSKLDAKSGNEQVGIKNKDRDNSTFILQNGLYRISQISFGPRIASSIFHRTTDVALSAVKF